MISGSAAKNLIDSHAAWWGLAGLQMLVDEAPVNWLAASTATPQPAVKGADTPREAQTAAPSRIFPTLEKAAPSLKPPLDPRAIPDDWMAFQTWLANDPSVPGIRWSNRRILPHGDRGARLMIVSLCPEMEDDQLGVLHSGKAGALLDAMLRAVGLTRANCYLASLAMTRPPGGRLDTHELAALAPLLWHHVRLAKPDRLLLLGTDLTRLMASTDVAAARGQTLYINQDGVKVEAVATQHPLLLLDRPARKAAAWDSLKRLAQG
jgi:uracil-DNA glycosylase family 4